ncbi:MAG: TonB-dependent receptor [Tannerellaceae bacterium]|nr:TonB-dependent receptor [Tannerellaceae bacterium]
MRSFFGRVNYDYKSKYLFEFNLRRDGSSRFGTESRWGTFPSVSAGWRISEESFFEPLKGTFQNLKLRASWGQLGNDAAGNYDYHSLYAIYYYSFGGAGMTTLGREKIANPNLKWEETDVKDIALEGILLNGRASFEIDYYDKLTTGILTQPSIYLSAGNIEAPP